MKKNGVCPHGIRGSKNMSFLSLSPEGSPDTPGGHWEETAKSSDVEPRLTGRYKKGVQNRRTE